MQVLVVMIAAVHAWVEYEHVTEGHDPVYLYLVPTMLYLIPVVYAAVTFGLRGAVLTALWSAVLVLPNELLLHEGLERAGEVVQVAWIAVVAVFVGARVDRERSARLEAEFREERQRVSEERYRSIVNNVGEPIILLDAGWRVIEANAAAAALLGRSVDDLRGQHPPGDTGREIVHALEAQPHDGRSVPRLQLGEPLRWFEPIRMVTTDATGAPSTQLLLVDVTASIERERGLVGITHQTIAAREAEQRRIARDLHDGPLQSLLALWRELDGVATDAPEPTRTQLVRARGTTESVADELRRFSRDLRPSILDDLGVAAAIRSEAERLRERSEIDVRVRIIGTSVRLPDDVEVALLRIVQEAMRNVERHAKASRVTISLDFSSPEIRLRVSDDGVGLDPVPEPSALLAGSHLGLIGMQERARMVGGRFALSRDGAGGLEVAVDVPATPAAS